MSPPLSSIGARVLEALSAALRFVVVVTMAAMVAVVSSQVLLRYGFNTSLDWGEDMARMLFVWTMFMAIPLGVRDGAHIGIELVVRRLPLAPQRALTRTMALLAAALMATVSWQALLLVIDQWDENLPTLAIPTALFMVPVCLGAVLSILYLCPSIVTGIAARSAGSAE